MEITIYTTCAVIATNKKAYKDFSGQIEERFMRFSRQFDRSVTYKASKITGESYACIILTKEGRHTQISPEERRLVEDVAAIFEDTIHKYARRKGRFHIDYSDQFH